MKKFFYIWSPFVAVLLAGFIPYFLSLVSKPEDWKFPLPPLWFSMIFTGLLCLMVLFIQSPLIFRGIKRKRIKVINNLSKNLPAFAFKPNSMWLVVVECRVTVVQVSARGDGFFIPGQEPCYDFAHVSYWIAEVKDTYLYPGQTVICRWNIHAPDLIEGEEYTVYQIEKLKGGYTNITVDNGKKFYPAEMFVVKVH